uniref:Transposase n=1 Tax=Heterorhabditis bacteriophora TaxID=37862 RepID=A0A1I7WY43_HETBA
MRIAAETSIGRVWQEICRVRERLSAPERNRSYAFLPTTRDLHHKTTIFICRGLLGNNRRRALTVSQTVVLRKATHYEWQEPYYRMLYAFCGLLIFP